MNWVIGAALIGMSASPTQAAPIRQRSHLDVPSPRDFRAWVAYLSGGPQEWSVVHHPRLGNGIRELMFQELQQHPNPQTNAWVNYLVWKRDLNPTRFDRWHPSFTPALRQLTEPQTTSVPPVTPTPTPSAITAAGPPVSFPAPIPLPPPTASLTPPVDRTPPPTTPPPDSTPPVPQVISPEPGTLAISVILLGTGVWWRCRALPASRSSVGSSS